MNETREFTAGLDLGQARDYSALVIAEKVQVPEVREHVRHGRIREALEWREGFHVLDVRRWSLGTRYTQVVDDVADLLHERPLRGATTLHFDRTGVGRGVADIIEEAYRAERLPWVTGITMTGGARSHGANVAKRDLVTRTLVLLEQGRLQFARTPGLDVLLRELEGYRVKLSEDGHDRYEAETEAVHDDTVMALCLAAWDQRIGGRALDIEEATEEVSA